MELLLKRETFTAESTIGRLFVDGVFECFTLEDCVREIEGQPVEQWKIKGITAIARGRYRLQLHHSPKFGTVPMLVDTPGFTLVYIHWGNTAKDTEGCILVGKKQGRDVIESSRDAFHSLFGKIVDAINRGEEVWITVE